MVGTRKHGVFIGDIMVFILKREGKEIKRCNNEYDVMEWIHKHHSYSFYHAVKYEGYSVEEVKENE
jgi:hypothetical protein